MAQFALADELGDFLGRTLTPEEETQADLLLQLASAAIQSEAGQSLEFVADDTVSLRGNFGGSMWLPERPVIDVTAVTIRHGYGFPLAQVVTDTSYAWDRRGLLYRGPWFAGVETNASPYWGGWGGGASMVDVTYSHGYQEIPDDIRGVCLSAAARGFLNLDFSSLPATVPGSASGEVTDGYSVTYDSAERSLAIRNLSVVSLADDEKRQVRRYRPFDR